MYVCMYVCRVVILMPSAEWGGEGILEASVATGTCPMFMMY